MKSQLKMVRADKTASLDLPKSLETGASNTRNSTSSRNTPLPLASTRSQRSLVGKSTIRSKTNSSKSSLSAKLRKKLRRLNKPELKPSAKQSKRQRRPSAKPKKRKSSKPKSLLRPTPKQLRSIRTTSN